MLDHHVVVGRVVLDSPVQVHHTVKQKEIGELTSWNLKLLVLLVLDTNKQTHTHTQVRLPFIPQDAPEFDAVFLAELAHAGVDLAHQVVALVLGVCGVGRDEEADGLPVCAHAHFRLAAQDARLHVLLEHKHEQWIKSLPSTAMPLQIEPISQKRGERSHNLATVFGLHPKFERLHQKCSKPTYRIVGAKQLV